MLKWTSLCGKWQTVEWDSKFNFNCCWNLHNVIADLHLSLSRFYLRDYIFTTFEYEFAAAWESFTYYNQTSHSFQINKEIYICAWEDIKSALRWRYRVKFSVKNSKSCYLITTTLTATLTLLCIQHPKTLTDDSVLIRDLIHLIN